jgi:(1->4)-alpha-D-glucan 1-alpha-D-glucosylmutase
MSTKTRPTDTDSSTAPPAISSTYRLQLHKDFGFRDASRLVSYLSELGISHLYVSPVLSSRLGSTHGYDATDPTRLNPELGTEADFYALHEELRRCGMGLILDIVPNHMSASSENVWWMDTLENGPESAYASYFDVDWNPVSRNLEGKVLLPVLGKRFGEVLESGELKLVFREGRFLIQYFESLFPLAPLTYRKVLKHHIDQLERQLGSASQGYQEYAGIVAGLSALPESVGASPDVAGSKRLQFAGLTERLRHLVAGDAAIRHFLDKSLRAFDGKIGEPASFLLMERLLADQHYLLAYWQNVNEQINYRRFFTINDLVGMRIQDPLVFEATHALIRRLVEQGVATGLRIDHIDGLRDPWFYLSRLNESVAQRKGAGSGGVPVFVEKILAPSENLPKDWPVAGTTGYDFMNALDYFFIDPRGAKQIEEIYWSFLGTELRYEDILYQKKKLVMSSLLAVEMRALGQQLGVLAGNDRYARDVSRSQLAAALVETTAQLSVYRTYIRNLEIAPQDSERISNALRLAQTKKPDLDPAGFGFLRDVLLLQNPPHVLSEQREARLLFVMRWQQFTGPIMAKAFEDTFLYIYNPLISLNDVGGDPRPTVAAGLDFTKFVQERSNDWPHTLNATTTHDTKRSEDVRARISVLSEIPEEWQAGLKRWSKWNATHRGKIDGQPVPDRNEEIFLYQTMLGAWPLQPEGFSDFGGRLQEYAVKATREAMVHTRWTLPNVPHEQALQDFIAGSLKPGKGNRFLKEFAAFNERIAWFGMVNGLSQTLLKMVAPGVPDCFQGSELWDQRLVDPDNRRPVDYKKREELLARLKQDDSGYPGATMRSLSDGRDGSAKLQLIWKSLNFRQESGQLFAAGDFNRLDVAGRRKENVAAFQRRFRNERVIAIVPRFLARAGYPSKGVPGSDEARRFWANTRIRLDSAAPKSWKNILTGETIAITQSNGRSGLDLAQVFAHFPVALLTRSKPKPKKLAGQ